MDKRSLFGLIIGTVVTLVIVFLGVGELRKVGIVVPDVLVTSILGFLNVLNGGFWRNILPARKNYQMAMTEENRRQVRRSGITTAMFAFIVLALGVVLSVLTLAI